MMIVDRLVSLIAPLHCLGCEEPGTLLCYGCAAENLQPIPPRCYRCHASTLQSQVCRKCRPSVALSHVWIVAEYQGIARDAIEVFKFERAGGAAQDLARRMSEAFPLLPADTVVCYVPTANSRRRTRGYDQAELLARCIASNRGLSLVRPLLRIGNSRQVGTARSDRRKQAKVAYEISKPALVQGRPVLLVDDVTTSGATLEAVARLLKRAGAKSVDGVVFAQAVSD